MKSILRKFFFEIHFGAWLNHLLLFAISIAAITLFFAMFGWGRPGLFKLLVYTFALLAGILLGRHIVKTKRKRI